MRASCRCRRAWSPGRSSSAHQPALLASWIESTARRSTSSIPSPLARNAGELQRAADRVGVDLRIFFARKANKALALVDEARRHRARGRRRQRARAAAGARARRSGRGRRRDRGGQAARAARALRRRGRDGRDRQRGRAAAARSSVADSARSPVPVALRLAPALGAERPHTRFGLAPHEMIGAASTATGRPAAITPLTHRRRALPSRRLRRGRPRDARWPRASRSSTRCASAATTPAFIDIGGGIPMSYLDDAGRLGRVLERAPRGPARAAREPLTFERPRPRPDRPRAARSSAARTSIRTSRRSTRGDWLARVLGDRRRDRHRPQTVAEAIRARGLAAALRARALTPGRLRADRRAGRVPQAAPRRDVADRRSR